MLFVHTREFYAIAVWLEFPAIAQLSNAGIITFKKLLFCQKDFI